MPQKLPNRLPARAKANGIHAGEKSPATQLFLSFASMRTLLVQSFPRRRLLTEVQVCKLAGFALSLLTTRLPVVPSVILASADRVIE